ncbi:MAG: hypothetical protein AB7S71_24730 [Dongiaceae bacterium]
MPLTDEERKSIVEIWSKAVDTQMHFNEMSVKSRQLGLTFVAGALGVGIVLLGRGSDFSIPVFSVDVHVSVLIVLAAALALMAVRILDLNVYHKMLRGAVSFGEDFEENYMKQIFQLEKGMTQAISHFSRFSDAKVEANGTKYQYVGNVKVSAEKKIRAFYRNTITILILAAIVLFIFTSHTLLAETVSGGGGR